ncbi:MAG: hypothetical protein RL274_2793 [Pseudomonadota bacterium]
MLGGAFRQRLPDMNCKLAQHHALGAKGCNGKVRSNHAQDKDAGAEIAMMMVVTCRSPVAVMIAVVIRIVTRLMIVVGIMMVIQGDVAERHMMMLALPGEKMLNAAHRAGDGGL